MVSYLKGSVSQVWGSFQEEGVVTQEEGVVTLCLIGQDSLCSDEFFMIPKSLSKRKCCDIRVYALCMYV